MFDRFGQSEMEKDSCISEDTNPTPYTLLHCQAHDTPIADTEAVTATRTRPM